MYKILVVFVPPKGRGHPASLLNYAFFVTRLCWLLLSDVAFRAFLQCVYFCLHYFDFARMEQRNMKKDERLLVEFQ